MPGEFFFNEPVQIHFQHIVVDNSDIIEFPEGFVQNGEQTAVDLHTDHLVRPLGKLGCEHTDTGADLDHTGAGRSTAQFCHTGADRRIDEEILAQGLGKGEAIAGEQIPDHRDIGQILHGCLLKADKAV